MALFVEARCACALDANASADANAEAAAMPTLRRDTVRRFIARVDQGVGAVLAGVQVEIRLGGPRI